MALGVELRVRGTSAPPKPVDVELGGVPATIPGVQRTQGAENLRMFFHLMLAECRSLDNMSC